MHSFSPRLPEALHVGAGCCSQFLASRPAGHWLSKVSEWNVVLALFVSKPLPYVTYGDFKKLEHFFKGTLGLRLSVITTPDAQSTSCVMFYRLPTGLESTAARLSPGHCRLPGERGPGLRRWPAQGGTEVSEQGQVSVWWVCVILSRVPAF